MPDTVHPQLPLNYHVWLCAPLPLPSLATIGLFMGKEILASLLQYQMRLLFVRRLLGSALAPPTADTAADDKRRITTPPSEAPQNR